MGSERNNVGAKIQVTAPDEPFPVRGVIIWPRPYDLVLYPYLANWLLCDGAGGTPDYVGHHVRGAVNDAAVGTVIGLDINWHFISTWSNVGGVHDHAIDAVLDHKHTIDEYCHDHCGCVECAHCTQVISVDANLDGVRISTLPGTFRPTIEEDSHNHCNNFFDEIGYTGDDGAHTHTESEDPGHIHAISAFIFNANNVPLTRLTHFIQYIG